MFGTTEDKDDNSNPVAEKMSIAPHRKRNKYLFIFAAMILLTAIFLVLSFYFFETNTLITLGYVFRHLYILSCLALLIFLLYSIKKETGVLKWYKAIFWIILFSIMLLPVPFGSTPDMVVDDAAFSTCKSNLKNLHSRFIDYSNRKNHRYPESDKWCDLLNLKKNDYFTTVCPNKYELGESCSYSMNPNCEPNSPRDVVLLFESKAGWNQSGGPELLNPHNHEGKGCSILFNDGHIEFINTKDLKNLKWK